MNLGFLDKALDGLEGKDLGALVDTLQQAAARTLEFDGEYPAQQVQACLLHHKSRYLWLRQTTEFDIPTQRSSQNLHDNCIRHCWLVLFLHTHDQAAFQPVLGYSDCFDLRFFLVYHLRVTPLCRRGGRPPRTTLGAAPKRCPSGRLSAARCVAEMAACERFTPQRAGL